MLIQNYWRSIDYFTMIFVPKYHLSVDIENLTNANREYEVAKTDLKSSILEKIGFYLSNQKKRNLWCHSCPSSLNNFFEQNILASRFFQPDNYQLYKNYDLLMTWSQKGIEQIPK